MERRTCVVPLCRNERFHLVHKFPMKDSRAEMWRVALNIPELMDMDMKELRLKHLVCSRHFKKTDYKNINSRNLNWNAVPSINLISFDDKNCYDSATFNILTNQPISFSDTKPESIVPLKRTGSIYDTNALTMEETPGRSSVPQPQDISPRIPTKNTQRSKEVIRSISMPALTKNAAPQMRKPGKRKREEEPKVIDLATESHGQGLLILEAAQEDTPSLTEQDVLDRILSNIQIDPAMMTESQNDPVDDGNYLVLLAFDTIIDYFWLRDHCRCPECYNYSTNQRKLSIRSIPLDIQPKICEVEGDLLHVTWPDGHTSQYSVDDLRKRTLDHRKLEKPSPVLWNRDSIQQLNYARVSMTDYLVDDQVSRSVVQSLVDYGVAFVENVPANATFTEIVIKRLFAIHRTHFGELWTFSDGMGDHLDTAYTSESLPAHTDNTYFNDASGLQILHCIDYKAKGGLSLLVDGFNVLENLKRNYPDTYERLKKYQIPAENKDKVCHHTHCGPVIIEDPVDGKLQQIRYNNPDRAYMNTLPQREMKQFYGDLQILAAEIEDPANEFWFQLKPGTVMFFDNWRLLHGRSEFSGKRVMSGSYVSRTEFMSVARTMNIVP